ncbi:MAG: tryptophan--tRNA ligase [Proteobacteria bacterium]|nr:tryptophan--tRNA ligase [Pseudomonadota bacterium]
MIALTGIKPTGQPHLGNFIGAIKPALALQNRPEITGYYFIADYHALVSERDPACLAQKSREVAATWLACGLDPEKSCIYRQSDISEIFELHWILSCLAAKGYLNRAHAYKAAMQVNQEKGQDLDQGVSLGLFSYPVLMAADILIVQAQLVPVGEDQKQHVEIARDIAMKFHHDYGDVLTIPQIAEVAEASTLCGFDGRKMSKSYGNHIPIFCDSSDLQKLIKKIPTDSSTPQEPKAAKGVLFDLFKSFATEDQINSLKEKYQHGVGWGEVKESVYQQISSYFASSKEKYDHFMAHPENIDAILIDGASRVRKKARQVLKQVKKAIGVGNNHMD